MLSSVSETPSISASVKISNSPSISDIKPSFPPGITPPGELVSSKSSKDDKTGSSFTTVTSCSKETSSSSNLSISSLLSLSKKSSSSEVCTFIPFPSSKEYKF